MEMEMQRIKTPELVNKALDWAVAIADKRNPIIHGIQCGSPGVPFKVKGFVAIPCYNGDCWTFEPTIKWELAGPIIQENLLVLSPDPQLGWVCRGYMDATSYSGATPLIAAMRCFVASQLGEEVDVPVALLD